MLNRINEFLDRYVLPWPVRFLTFRFVILATIALLVPLIVYAGNQVLVLAINSYLNTMSVAVSSIVLLYSMVNEAHQKQIAEMQEQRAQEDHQHVTEMHRLVLEALANQQAEMEHLKEEMTTLQGQPYTAQAIAPVPDLQKMHRRGAARFQAQDTRERMARQLHRQPLADAVRKDLGKLSPDQPDTAR